MYNLSKYIETPVGNNAFSYEKRTNKRLFLLALKKIQDFDAIKLGSEIVFEEDDGSLSGRKKGRPRKDEILKEEDFRTKLYVNKGEDGNNSYLQIAKNLISVYKRNDDRLYSEDGKEIYKRRSCCVEPVFGNIKMNLKFERFSLRGFNGVQIEWNLISLAHNLQKIINFKAS